jgi:hypothetical protein
MCFAFALAQSQMRAVSPPALLKTKGSSAQPVPPCLVARAAQALTAYPRQLFEIPISERLNQDFTARRPQLGLFASGYLATSKVLASLDIENIQDWAHRCGRASTFGDRLCQQAFQLA